jgi:hypothetical protein
VRSDRAAAGAAVALAGVLAGCRITDLERPIGLLADGLDELDRANLEEAAACWNLRFGTRFVVGDEAAAAEQHVEAFYDELTCVHTAAQVQSGWPHALAICPLGLTRRFGDFMFRVLSHELGHVLNIVGHPDDPAAVMQRGGELQDDMFLPVDVMMFGDANPGFLAVASCARVVRSTRPDDDRVSRCVCED